MIRDVTQDEADALLQMEKHRSDDEIRRLPDTGGNLVVPLVSTDKSESFSLDISRARLNLLKGKFQNRARGSIVLARIDIGGPPHRNPDDEEIPCPHIHLYREGYGARWAYQINNVDFSNPADHWQTLLEFMRYCKITRPPEFLRGLFT